MPRTATGPFDYGDAETIGLQVKRVGKTICDSDLTNDYGVFLGPDGHGRLYVGIWNLSFRIHKYEAFDSVEEMHKVWMLD